MKLPPALSWMHLFSRDASFLCDDSTPSWMRTQIDNTGRTVTPSPGTPDFGELSRAGAGGGEGLRTIHSSQPTTHKSPHPNPLPEYRARGQEGERAIVTGGTFSKELRGSLESIRRFQKSSLAPLALNMSVDSRSAGLAEQRGGSCRWIPRPFRRRRFRFIRRRGFRAASKSPLQRSQPIRPCRSGIATRS